MPAHQSKISSKKAVKNSDEPDIDPPSGDKISPRNYTKNVKLSLPHGAYAYSLAISSDRREGDSCLVWQGVSDPLTVTS
jgi:hypothetical protein